MVDRLWKLAGRDYCKAIEFDDLIDAFWNPDHGKQCHVRGEGRRMRQPRVSGLLYRRDTGIGESCGRSELECLDVERHRGLQRVWRTGRCELAENQYRPSCVNAIFRLERREWQHVLRSDGGGYIGQREQQNGGGEGDRTIGVGFDQLDLNWGSRMGEVVGIHLNIGADAAATKTHPRFL